MQPRQFSADYFFHLKRLVRIMSGNYLRHIPPSSPTTRRSSKSCKSLKPSKSRETCGEYQRRWDILRQNRRLANSIETMPGVINFTKNQQQFRKHLRDRRVRSKLSSRIGHGKQIKIIDIVWKDCVRNCRQEFQVTNLTTGVSYTGTVDGLRAVRMRVEEGEFGIFRVKGGENRRGRVTLREMNILPIMFRKRYVGDIVVETRML